MVGPLIVFEAPLNVCVPVLAVKVEALLARLPPNVIAAAADSFQIAPLFSVTSPVKVFAPVALVMFKVPVTLVTPDAVNVNAPILNVEPDAIFTSVQAAAAATVTVRFPSIYTISPLTGALCPAAPPDVAAQTAVEAQFPDATEYRLAAFTLVIPSTETSINHAKRIENSENLLSEIEIFINNVLIVRKSSF